jgi:hypothetical protein
MGNKKPDTVEKTAAVTDIKVKTQKERRKEEIANKYYERLQKRQVINYENAKESVQERYDVLLKKADKEEIPKLKRELAEIIKRLSVRAGGPLKSQQQIPA